MTTCWSELVKKIHLKIGFGIIKIKLSNARNDKIEIIICKHFPNYDKIELNKKS